MPATRRLILALAIIGASSVSANSQNYPNMIGTWKGSANAVHIGSTPYRSATGNGVQFPENAVEFTYVISDQHGNRFAGEGTGGNYKETIIGALQPDNRGGIILDNDGQYLFTLVDPNTIDVCYSHQYPTSKIVACYQLKRLQ